GAVRLAATGRFRSLGLRSSLATAAEAAALSASEVRPRIAIEIGTHDVGMGPSLELAYALGKRGADPSFETVRAARGSGSADWTLWGPRIDSWIGFHQATYGRAGAPGDPSETSSSGDAQLVQYRDAQAAAWAKVETAARALKDDAGRIGGLEVGAQVERLRT